MDLRPASPTSTGPGLPPAATLHAQRALNARFIPVPPHRLHAKSLTL